MNWNNKNKQESQKTRNISMYNYLNTLQKEYLVMEIRAKIYPIITDKKYYKAIMLHKEIKIRDIARRNYLDCIFDKAVVRANLEGEIINKRGLPNFTYRDERVKSKFAQKDIAYYFLHDTDIKVFFGEDDCNFEIGTIKSFDETSMTVTVRLKGGKEVVSSCSNVTRIL